MNHYERFENKLDSICDKISITNDNITAVKLLMLREFASRDIKFAELKKDVKYKSSMWAAASSLLVTIGVILIASTKDLL